MRLQANIMPVNRIPWCAMLRQRSWIWPSSILLMDRAMVRSTLLSPILLSDPRLRSSPSRLRSMNPDRRQIRNMLSAASREAFISLLCASCDTTALSTPFSSVNCRAWTTNCTEFVRIFRMRSRFWGKTPNYSRVMSSDLLICRIPKSRALRVRDYL